MAAGGEEEARGVPGVLEFIGDVLACGLAVGDDCLKAVDIGIRNNALVIIHEVAVIGGQRIGVEIGAGLSREDRSGVVVGLCEFNGGVSELGECAGLDQTAELVLSEEIEISAGLNVGDHVCCRVSLRNGLNGRVDGDAVFVGAVEVGDLSLCQIYRRFGRPDYDIIGSGEIAAGSTVVAGAVRTPPDCGASPQATREIIMASAKMSANSFFIFIPPEIIGQQQSAAVALIGGEQNVLCSKLSSFTLYHSSFMNSIIFGPKTRYRFR